MNHAVTTEVLQRQVDFLVEIDKLKSIDRRSILVNGDRYENSAEHSWHVATCAAVLAEHVDGSIDLAHVLLMLLVHDIVEIDAGDTFAYDADGRQDQRTREQTASRRLFGILPAAQASALLALWREFDAQETAEAKFANSVDRFMPLLHNFHAEGGSWLEHDVSRSQVTERVACIQNGAPSLWSYVIGLIDESVRRGYLRP